MAAKDEEDPLQGKPRGGRWSAQLVLLGCNAALGGFLFGYDTTSMSAALLQMKRPRDPIDPCPGLTTYALNVPQQEMITSFVVLGAFLGAACAGTLNSWIGRRGCILTAAVCFIIGELWMSGSMSVTEVLCARLVVGLGVGFSSHSVPLFISECAPPDSRGGLCFLNDMMIVVGQMVAAVVSAAFFYAEVTNGWRWILGCPAVLAALMFVGFYVQPESPRWLVSEGQPAKAKEVLRRLRGPGVSDEDVQKEIDDMAAGNEQNNPGSQGSIYQRFILNGRTRRALMLGCGLQLLQQGAGINTIMYYGATVLQNAGPAYDVRSSNCFTDENKRAVSCTAVFALALLIGVVISWCLVDRIGRRPLILYSLAGVIVTLAGLGGVFAQPEVEKSLVIVFVVGYLLSFGIGMSPVPWTVNAEIYPMANRAQCLSLSAGTNWGINYIVAQTFLTLAAALSTYSYDQEGHPDGVFWLYSSVGVVGFVFIWLYMPETKGLSLEQIGDLFVDSDDFTTMK